MTALRKNELHPCWGLSPLHGLMVDRLQNFVAPATKFCINGSWPPCAFLKTWRLLLNLMRKSLVITATISHWFRGAKRVKMSGGSLPDCAIYDAGLD